VADEPRKHNGLTTFMKWWPILLFLLGMAVTWGTFMTRVEMLTQEQEAQRIKLEARDETLTQIQVQLAEIQRDILYIRERLDRGE